MMLKKRNSVIVFTLFIILFLSNGLFAGQDLIDLSDCLMVTSKKASNVEKKAIDVLFEEIKKRTSIELKIKNKIPKGDQPVIVVSQIDKIDDLLDSYKDVLSNVEKPEKEGFIIKTLNNDRTIILIAGADPRGTLYGVGRLLRKINFDKNSIILPNALNISTSPEYHIRGHQLGYRPKTNSYDAWTDKQFDQYIRELALFGANSIEIVPPRTDDDYKSRHMLYEPLDMMSRLSNICDSYDMDVWIWYPNMGSDYTNPDVIKEELKEREEIFKKLKRIDCVFFPGGDPGHLHPDVLFPWMEQVAKLLNKYHPDAKLWVSPQAFAPTTEWLASFYAHVNKKPEWLGGVVFAPWVRTTLPEMRRIVSPELPIRRYPDITHTYHNQYPVRRWDVALAATVGRECMNPRPVDEKHIHNALDQYADGSISYSEGTNDDINKFIWSDQDWDPETPVFETLRDYSRFFIGKDYVEDFSHGTMALEENWRGPLLANTGVERTLLQWQNMEKRASQETMMNFRFQNNLIRAYYDAYVKVRLIHESELQERAKEVLRQANQIGAAEAITEAEKILKIANNRAGGLGNELRKRCIDLADSLYNSIGAQLTVTKHGAIFLRRGAFVEAIDAPLNDYVWLMDQFSKIKKVNAENEKLEIIDRILNRTNPGPGGFYDNFGTEKSWKRVQPGEGWETDPGSLKSPRIGLGIGMHASEWVPYAKAMRKERVPIPLASTLQVRTLYDTPLTIVYDNLDSNASYRLKVTYPGRFESRMRLVADGKYVIHSDVQAGTLDIHEFDVPQKALRDGKLELTWTCLDGERGCQVSELWLIKK